MESRSADDPAVTEGLARKARTEARLAESGIWTPPHLPRMEAENEVRIRPAAEVALRAYALFLTAVRAESLTSRDEIPVEEMRNRFPRGFAALSPAEAAFFAAAEPEQQIIVDCSWRYESLALLRWALNWSDELPWPTTNCDVPVVVRWMVEGNEEDRIGGAVLRPTAQLLDALDLHFRLHWAVRQAGLDGRPAPGDLVGGVVMERHRALNWLTSFGETDWDEVDTST